MTKKVSTITATWPPMTSMACRKMWMGRKNLRKVGTVLRHRRSQRYDCLQSPRRELLILGSPLEVGCTWPVVQPGVLVLLVLEGWVGLDTGGNTRVAANCSLRFDTYY